MKKAGDAVVRLERTNRAIGGSLFPDQWFERPKSVVSFATGGHWSASALAGSRCGTVAAEFVRLKRTPRGRRRRWWFQRVVLTADALCTVAGDGNCERKLDEVGRDRAPAEPPVVRSSEVVSTTSSSDQASLGGLVLVMCGTDALGSRYESEMLVFRDRDMTLRAINPVYWGGYGIGTGGQTTIRSPAPTSGC